MCVYTDTQGIAPPIIINKTTLRTFTCFFMDAAMKALTEDVTQWVEHA